MDFNRPAENSSFRYERNPMTDRGFMILKRNTRNEYDAVGDYLVIDDNEEISLSEKKVMNFIALLNNDDDYVLDLGDLTQSQLRFHIKPEKTKTGQTEVVLFELGERGTSKENAIISIDEGVIA